MNFFLVGLARALRGIPVLFIGPAEYEGFLAFSGKPLLLNEPIDVLSLCLVTSRKKSRF